MAKIATQSRVTQKIATQHWITAIFLSLPWFFLSNTSLFINMLWGLAGLGLLMLFALIKQQGTFNSADNALRVLPRCILFIYLPMLIAAVDADLRSSNVLWEYPLLGFMALAVLVLVRAQQAIKPIAIILSFLVCIWLFNGWSQLMLGMDMFNRPFTQPKAHSLFTTSQDFGFYMGVLGTIPLYTLYILGKNRLSHLLMTMWVVASILMMGQLSACVMLAITILPYLYLNYVQPARRRIVPIVVVPLWLFLLAIIVVQTYPIAINALSWGQYQQLIWQMWPLSAEIFSQSWFNGVGVANFEAAFQPYLALNAIAPLDISYPHQIILQIATETGLLGLLGLLLLWAALWRLWSQANAEQRKLALPVIMPLIALWWPINAHRDFYSLELMAMSLLLLALSIAALTQQSDT